MKKSNGKVDARTINFTKLVYNNCTMNVNADNNSNNKLKSLRKNLLYIILLIISIVATIFSLIIITYDLVFNKQIPYLLYVLLPVFTGIIGFLIKNCNH